MVRGWPLAFDARDFVRADDNNQLIAHGRIARPNGPLGETANRLTLNVNWQQHLIASHWTHLFILPALLLGLAALPRLPRPWRNVWAVSFACVTLSYVVALTSAARGQVLSPPLWDFKVFWTVGHVALSGHNVYDPASYLPYKSLVNPTDDAEFNTIALGIGMPYPPPAIVLFYLLGFISNIASALALWYAAIACTVVVCASLLFRDFFPREKIAGVVAAAALLLVLPATAETIELGQLNFLVLAFLLLFWRERNGVRAGLWLAPILILRPFFAIFAIYLIARRRWKTLGATAATLAVLFLISIPFVGLHGLQSYAHENPSQRYPQTYFTGSDSLYKIVSHFDRDATGYFSLASHPAFVLVAVLLLGGSAYVCSRAGVARRDACLASLLALGLFLYPNTGSHYAVLLLPLLCLLWRDRDRLGIGTYGAAGLVTLEYFALSFGNAVGAVFALDAILFAFLALRSQSSGIVAGGVA